MVHKEVIDNHLYVYMNGSLLYKRWLDRDYGFVFCSVFKPFKSNEADFHPKAPVELIWECNACANQEYTTCVSSEDIQQLQCSNCGDDEFHLAPAKKQQ